MTATLGIVGITLFIRLLLAIAVLPRHMTHWPR